jgi:hypothetical protein
MSIDFIFLDLRLVYPIIFFYFLSFLLEVFLRIVLDLLKRYQIRTHFCFSLAFIDCLIMREFLNRIFKVMDCYFLLCTDYVTEML